MKPVIPQDLNASEELIEKYAQEVMEGVYGNWEERKMKLGILYDRIQAKVNEVSEKNLNSLTAQIERYEDIAMECINNELSYEEIKINFPKIYPIIQLKINEFLNRDIMYQIGEKDIEMLAKRVKEGLFGDGKERVHKLAQLYDPVQKKVKELNKEMTKLKMKLF